ncbi:MFS transporter [bacterium]|nr:MFS transporter [bacterium]
MSGFMDERNSDKYINDTSTLVPDDKRQTSLRASVWDGSFYSGMVGFGELYYIPLLNALKATNYQVGLFAALPQLCVAFSQFISIEIIERVRNRKLIILGGASTQAVILGVIGFTLLAGKLNPWIFILFASIYFTFNGIAIPAWNSLIGDLTQGIDRGIYFGKRNGLCQVVLFLSLLSAGLLLQRCDNLGVPLKGFVIILMIAMACRLVSVGFLARHFNVPYRKVEGSYFSFWDFIRRTKQSNFAHFTFFMAAMTFCVNISGPFFAIYMLRDLEWTYWQYTLAQGVSVLIQFLSMPRWGNIADRYGNKAVMRITSVLLPILPILWLFTRNYYCLISIMFLSGLAWGGWALSAGNFFFDSVTPQKRARCSAYLNFFNCIGIFLGALTGGFITTHVPQTVHLGAISFTFFSVLQAAFLTSGLLRFIAVTIFMPIVHEVREVSKPDTREMILMMASVRPVVGVKFQLFTGGGKKVISKLFKNSRNKNNHSDLERKK